MNSNNSDISESLDKSVSQTDLKKLKKKSYDIYDVLYIVYILSILILIFLVLNPFLTRLWKSIEQNPTINSYLGGYECNSINKYLFNLQQKGHILLNESEKMDIPSVKLNKDVRGSIYGLNNRLNLIDPMDIDDNGWEIKTVNEERNSPLSNFALAQKTYSNEFNRAATLSSKPKDDINFVNIDKTTSEDKDNSYREAVTVTGGAEITPEMVNEHEKYYDSVRSKKKGSSELKCQSEFEDPASCRYKYVRQVANIKSNDNRYGQVFGVDENNFKSPTPSY